MTPPSTRADQRAPRGHTRFVGPTVGLLMSVAMSCTFDTSGIGSVDARRRPPDASLRYTDGAADTVVDPDVTIRDAVVRPDGTQDMPTDVAVADAPADAPTDAPADAGADAPADTTPDARVMLPVATEDLALAFSLARVNCVTRYNEDRGYDIPIVDTPDLFFVSGGGTLANAPQETLDWVGLAPSVTLVWNPNGCEYEGIGGDWTSAGLLIRTATVDHEGRLVLPPDADVSDINMLNVEADGRWPDEFAEPDDSRMSDYPEMRHSVDRAKALILGLARGD